MTSYDSALETDKDWVRFLVGDVDMTRPKLQDEEIAAILAEEAANNTAGVHVKYLAAARALETLVARWQVQGAGVVSKQVGELTITRSAGLSGAQAAADQIKCYRVEAARLLLPKPRPFAVL